MVEATAQLNYTLNTNVTGANQTTIITSGTANSIKSSSVNVANVSVEAPNDFNLIAANCNTNVCFFCQKQFTNVYNCRRHIRTHSGEKPFQCNVCGKKFSRQSTLNAHEKVHTGNQIFKCEVCGQAFDVYRHLTEHMIVHRQDKPFTCKICNKSYSRATVLSQHMKSHSVGNTNNNNNNINSNSGSSNDTMPKTITITSSTSNDSPQTVTTTVAMPVISQPVYKCQQCEKMFVTPSELKNHESVHVLQQKEDKKVIVKEVIVIKPEEPQIVQLMQPQIKCYVCDEHFNTEQDRANHAVIHNRIVTTTNEQQAPPLLQPPPQQQQHHLQQQQSIQVTQIPAPTIPVITIEPPTLPLITSLDVEMSVPDDEITYDDVIKLTLLENKSPCNVCSKSHTKSQPCEKFKCDVCDKRFSNLGNFNVHKRIHKREKPFRCSVCGKSFRLAKSLTVHMVLHTENESFDCPVCDRSFNRSGSLKVHMKSHTTAELQQPKRAYIDVMCHDADDDLFGDDDDKNCDVMLDFIDDNPTFCDICGKQFIQCNANTRTHKCSKYPIDEDFDDEDEQLSSLDIWNCE